MAKYRIGVDTGGTFTDTVVLDEAGEVTRAKAATTPHNLTEGCIESIRRAADELGMKVEELLRDTSSITHASTIVTNAIATLSGTKTGLLVTRGFGDTMRMARSPRTNSRDLHAQRQLPELVAPDCIEEVTERVDCLGKEVIELDKKDAERAIDRLVNDKKVRSIAVCFLWSFENPKHEEEVGEIIRRKYPGLHFSLSCHVHPVIREYERMVTTVFNSYTGALLTDHIAKLEGELRGLGFAGEVSHMSGLGGMLTSAVAEGVPIQLISSGPVGGVVGSNFLGSVLGRRDIITADVGGTSFDTTLISGGAPTFLTRAMISGFLTGLSLIEVDSIGAGGGSIIWVDPRGLPAVGPRSAGAVPGPACYGRGGTDPTVTDAWVVLNMINPDYFLGGTMKLHRDLAVSALETVAKPLKMSVEGMAAGALTIASELMAGAIRAITVERGFDPRLMTLISYGGAGGLVLGAIGRILGIKEVLFPSGAATFSSWGLLQADYRRDLVRTCLWSSLALPDPINAAFRDLEAEMEAEMARMGFKREEIEITRTCDMRYTGQAWEVRFPMPEKDLTVEDVAHLRTDFDRFYEGIYGKETAWMGGPIESANAAVCGIGRYPKLPVKEYTGGGKDPSYAQEGERSVCVPEKAAFEAVKIYDLDRLLPDAVIEGTAIAEGVDTTIYVNPGAKLAIDKYRNAVLTLP